MNWEKCAFDIMESKLNALIRLKKPLMGKFVIVLNDEKGVFIGRIKDILLIDNFNKTAKERLFCINVTKSIGVPKYQEKTNYIETKNKESIFIRL